jgi:transcriptional regulator with XRE-family HTH domain
MCMKSHLFQPNRLFMQARFDLGLSQNDVALRLGVSLKQVWRWENGRAQPRLYYRQLLCTLFQKTPEELGFDPRREELPEPATTDSSTEARFRVLLERYQADPVYQREYQAFLKRSQQFNYQHRCAVSFVDWFLAAHPEQAGVIENHNEGGCNQPA